MLPLRHMLHSVPGQSESDRRAARIADGLELVWEEFLNRYIDKSWLGIKNFLLSKRNGACVFLERIKG